MKKISIFMLSAALVLTMLTGCNGAYVASSTKQDKIDAKAVQETKVIQEMMPKDDKSIDLLEEMDVRSDILSAINATKRISGGDFAIASDGGYYYRKSCENQAYAYYGKAVDGVYATASSDPFVLAVLEDGSVYNGTTLIAKGAGIRDVCWKTHSTNIDAYLLGKDGQLYYYDPYNEQNENEFELEEGYKKITAICRAGSYALFFGSDGQVYRPNIFMSGGSASWKNVDVRGWQEIVVAACAYAEDKDVYTIAGISADGVVHATGTYAEDILAMGDLSYITMFDDASLIVGLTPDGTLKFAGNNADAYAELALEKVAGVKAFDDKVWAVGTDGSIYSIDRANDIGKLTVDATNGSYYCFYMASDGTVYQNEDNIWKETDNLNAGITDNTSLLYYLELSKQRYNYGRGFSSSYMDLKDMKFMMDDLNGDGQEEILIPSGISIYIGCIYNGTLSSILHTNDIVGYYPRSQVLVTVLYGAGTEIYEYGHLINGAYTMFATRTTHHFDGEEPYEVYQHLKKIGELPYTDEEGTRLREKDAKAMSQKEFNVLLDTMVGEEIMQKCEMDFQPCTEENFVVAFLNGHAGIPHKKAFSSDTMERGSAVSEPVDPLEIEKIHMEDINYVTPDSREIYLTEEDVRNLSAEELRIARNEIYARHGRRFRSQDLQEYFDSKDWYHGTIQPDDFQDDLLNEYEKANIQLFKNLEERLE